MVLFVFLKLWSGWGNSSNACLNGFLIFVSFNKWCLCIAIVLGFIYIWLCARVFLISRFGFVEIFRHREIMSYRACLVFGACRVWSLIDIVSLVLQQTWQMTIRMR